MENILIPSSAQAKIRLLERGMTVQSLAAETGMAIKHCYNVLEGHSTSRRGRRRIEGLLGRIWEDAPQESREESGHLPATV